MIFAKHASSKWMKHYEILIERGKCRNKNDEQYYEKHHIVPRCLGGKNETENYTFLTPEEHYTAHLILCKLFPENGKLLRAVAMMTVDSPTTPRKNKMYGWVKRRLAEHRSTYMKEWHKHNEHPMKGKTHTPEVKAQIGRSNSTRQKKDVYCFSTKTGELIKAFKGVAEASIFAGVHPQTIYSCIRVPGKRTAAGYSWSYSSISPGPIKMCPAGNRRSYAKNS